MPFDIEEARKIGKTDEEIANYLATKVGFDIDAAKSSGKTASQIAEYLAPKAHKGTITPYMETRPETLLSEEQREKEFGVIRKAPPKWIAPMETGLEMIGLLGGGAIGSGLGPTGTAGGAALGYGAAKATSNIIQEMLGYRKPKPTAERLKETGEDILEGALIEAAGAGVGKVVSKVATPVKQLLTAPWGEALSTSESRELMRIYKEFNIPATPSDFIPSSKTLSIVEGVLGYRPVSGDVMLNKALQKVEALNNARIKLINKNAPSDTVEVVGNRIRTEAKNMLSKYTEAKGEKLSNLVDDFARKMGVSERYKTGQRFSEVMSQAREIRHGFTEDLYDKTKKMLPLKGQDVVPLSPDTISLAKQLMKEELSKPPTMQDRKLLGILKFFGGGEAKLPEGIEPYMVERDPLLKEKIESTMKPKLTWTGMKETRSDLLERIRDIYRSQGQATKKSRIFGELSDAIDGDMSTFAEKKGGDLWRTYSKAKESSRAMHELFDKDILKIMKSDPEDILGRVINKGEVSLLKQIRIAGGEQALIPLREGFFKRILDSSTTNQVLNPKRLATNLDKVTAETLNELTTLQQRVMLKNIIRTGEFFSEKMGKMKTVEFLETISNTDPSRVINGIIKPNNSYLVKVAKKLFSPERLQELQAIALEEKIFKISGMGNYMPVSSSKAWRQYEAPMKELLSPQSFQAVSDFLKAGQNMTKVEALAKNASQTGQVLLGSQVGGEVLRRPWRAPMVLGIPYLIAKIYTNPKSIKFLTRALKVDPVSAEGISLFTKAVTLAGLNLKKQEESERESSLLPFGIHKTEK